MKKDWSGYKYVLAAEAGQCVDIVLGIHSPENEVTSWHFRSHIVSDGVGAVTDLLRRNQVKIDRQPFLKDQKRPKALQRFWLFLKHLRNCRAINYDWRRYFPNEHGPALGMAYAFFDEQVTSALLSYCRQNNITLTSLLLAGLDKAAVAAFLKTPQERAWLIPLNLRGGTDIERDSANCTSSISLRLGDAAAFAPQDIHQRVRRIYDAGIHWGAWIYSNFAKYVGLRGLRLLMRYLKPSHCWMGVFSSLGNWDYPAGEPMTNRYLVMSPPVSEYCPITACAISWKGRLALNIQLHRSISHRLADAEALLKNWVQEVSAATLLNLEAIPPGFHKVSWEEIAKGDSY